MNLYGGLLHPGLASVLETALDAVCIMDANGTVSGWNGRAAELFGWSGEEAIGHRLSELIIPPLLRPMHEKGLAHFLATGEGPVLDRRIEVSALNANGDEFPVELSITATEDFGEPLFIGFVRDISERKALAERQQRRLQESDHRVKNMLTVVSAIARQTARSSDNTEDFLNSFLSRLDTLAKSHSLLTAKDAEDIPLSAIAEQVLGADTKAKRARFAGSEIRLSPAQVLGLSMILHELYTNAVKYGALCTEEGSIDLDWVTKDGEVTLTWTESGPPCPNKTPKRGFGQQMIEMSVKADLGGTLDQDWTEHGLAATIRFPLTA
jgi:PAS domain S-box-containing protein